MLHVILALLTLRREEHPILKGWVITVDAHLTTLLPSSYFIVPLAVLRKRTPNIIGFPGWVITLEAPVSSNASMS